VRARSGTCFQRIDFQVSFLKSNPLESDAPADRWNFFSQAKKIFLTSVRSVASIEVILKKSQGEQ
jgi:hypothetical protein